MKEVFSFRINIEYAHSLFNSGEGKALGDSVKVVELTKEDPKFKDIGVFSQQLKKESNKSFFFGWKIARKYSNKELSTAQLFQIKIKETLLTAGEECGTTYDEGKACDICGANAIQISPLFFKKGNFPKSDIAVTIAGELIVSQKFITAFKNRRLKGALFGPIIVNGKTSKFSQLIVQHDLELSGNTDAGINPFDRSISSGDEVYKCPKGHTIGLNLLSELYVKNSLKVNDFDLFATKQKIGVRRGLLRPQSLILCTHAFRNMVKEEKLNGIIFEIAHIV